MGAVLAAAIVAAVVVAGGGSDDAPPARSPAAPARVDRFDSGRAWAELRRQVRLGPRPAGSRRLRALAERLRRELPRGRFERVPGHPRLRNLVGRLPGTKPAIVIAAHHDTKQLPGFVGANDGAAGTAAVVELARALRRIERPAGAPQLRFVLFDGEEATDDSRPFLETGLRGSTAYAERHAGEVGALILLDFIAARDLSIVREGSSDRALWSRLREAAKAVGAGAAFPAGSGGVIADDHSPFLAQGVPAIDLIQWPYVCFHKRCDDLSAVSERSLDMTGESVLELVRTLLR
ncbi:MAG TPA: M28 family peptidase [Solirubrobacteraceae bacterium]|nr:M28 family peptidase [Solirubrobacteraceae bacterium]